MNYLTIPLLLMSICVVSGFHVPSRTTKPLRTGSSHTKTFASTNEEDVVDSVDKMKESLTVDTIGRMSPIAGELNDLLIGPSTLNDIEVATSAFLAEKRELNSLLDTTDAAAASQANMVEEILAVSRQAAEEAESKLAVEISKSIPLIPVQTFNDTMATIVPAKEVVGVPATKIDYPSVKRIIKFAASATGVYLCSPLLSLIDTSAVGLLSGTAQQAALNPAVAVTDYAALLIFFLYTGATNLVAAAQEKDRGVEGKPITTKSLATALQLSTYVGAALGAVLMVFARPLLMTLIGNDSISPEVFNAAMKYVRIRALGMPGAAIIGSAQAGCLGMQDVKSPLVVLAGAALINLCGDLLFVGSKSPLFGGAAGAAWATVFSQYAAAWFFIRWFCTKGKKDKVLNLTKNILELTGEGKSKGIGRRRRFNDAIKSFAIRTPGKSLASKVTSVTQKLRKRPSKKLSKIDESVYTTRGILAGKFEAVDLLKFPRRDRAQEYAPYFLPVTTTQVGRVSSYIAMSHVVSSTLGTTAMAAQQVIVSLFYCLTPIADSLSLTAQSVVPGLVEKKPSVARATALRKTMQNLFMAGVVFGAIMLSAVAMIPLLSRFFTADVAVRSLVNSVVPMLLGFFWIHGVCMASEGLMLAQKDLNFVGAMYGSFFFAVPYFMLRVKKKALAGVPVGLTSVWTIFVGYQTFRSAAFLARNLLLQRRNNREIGDTI